MRTLRCHLILMTLVLGCSRLCQAADTYSQPPTAQKDGGHTITISGLDAIQMQVDAFGKALTNAVEVGTRQSQPPTPVPASHEHILLAVAIVVAGILGFQRIAPRIGEFLNSRFNPWGEATDAAPDVAAEEHSFSEFASTFATGPSAPPPPAPPEQCVPSCQVQPRPAEDDSRPEPDPIEEFLARAPKDLALMRKVFSDIGRAPSEAARQALLSRLAGECHFLKGKASLPVLLPIWQMASTLEGLLKQLADKPSNVTPSALRTVASALDLLSALCLRGLKADLATDPPVRLLAVDDDPICLQAVSFALRKVFSQPDVAADGEVGLLKAEEHAYDVIFLDVEMPGIDGFELCARIHATAPNQTTPIVFVTSHSDFNARATSSLTGGQDLIGKPFLSFELAVKAFTLVLRRRLEPSARAAAGWGPTGKAVSDRATCVESDSSSKPLVETAPAAL